MAQLRCEELPSSRQHRSQLKNVSSLRKVLLRRVARRHPSMIAVAANVTYRETIAAARRSEVRIFRKLIVNVACGGHPN